MTESSSTESCQPERSERSRRGRQDILRCAQEDNSAKHLLLALLVAVAVFVGVAPTLTMPQFTGGNENIVVQTALEMKRGGPWLVPTMLGEPRVKKPPLVAWITAATVSDETVRQLDDPALRERAYIDLAWQVRWTGLLAGCVMIVATFFLGRALFDSRLGLIASIVVGTTILFQQYMRQSTSDVHLAMWVTIANACFAHAILRGRVRTLTLLGAAAAGFAFLCKGPVALLETVLPAIVMTRIPLPLGEGRVRVRDEDEVLQLGERPHRTLSQRERGALIASALGVFALVALPWFVYVYVTVPNVMETWFTEVSRRGATNLEPSHPAMYALLIPLSWPWIVMLIGGCVVAWRERRVGDWYALALIALPILIMVWFPDRKPRYLLPMLAPLAVLAARGALALFEMPREDRAARLVTILHFVVLGVVCIGFPIAGAFVDDLKRIGGDPWYPLNLAIWLAVAMASLLALGAVVYRRRRWALLVVTLVSVLALQAMFMWAYQDTRSGASELKPLADIIRERAPGAVVFDFVNDPDDPARRIDEELAIYLNRTILPANPREIAPADHPVVYVTRQSKADRRAEIDPVPPEGWSFLAKARERNNTWWAFVRAPDRSE